MIKTKNYISSKGLAKLIKERDKLKKAERPKVVKVVSWAASLGDRSENADYQYGKKKLREIDRRLRFLNSRINTAEVVNFTGKSTKIIQFGATVVIVDNKGQAKSYQILGENEIDSQKNIISWKSPLAKSLIGKSQGDEIIVKTPTGRVGYEITQVYY
jgi:transcription elongation factor GreB